MRNWRKLLGWVAVLVFAPVLLCIGVIGPCWRALLFDGIWVGSCPAGDVRPVARVSASGLGRGSKGTVTVDMAGWYADGRTGAVSQTPVRRFDVSLDVTDPAGTKSKLDVVEDRWLGTSLISTVELPKGPDGDWTLHVVADSPAGESAVDVVLPVYAPALAHVLTDAPMVLPGGTMRFRDVLLHEADLTPLEGRPGVWTVTDPEGEVQLEEKARTGPFGIAASTFPLAPDAPSGPWQVRFRSGAAVHSQTVEVRTFQLPRFTVDAASERRWWGRGDAPVVSGTVRYTSGAPVRGASVTVDVRASGEWPPPLDWVATRLIETDAMGRFRVAFGPVPADLSGQVTLALAFTATDPTGDTARGGASVLLSADRIVADAVTELADGLVPATNNRLFLRVTSPDGEPLRGATVVVRRDGDVHDVGIEAVADADGVAKLQVDPGQPVTVVVPATPVRTRPRSEASAVRATDGQDLVAGEALDVAGTAVIERWASAAQPCQIHGDAGKATSVSVIARIAGGRVTHVSATADDGNEDLAACIATRVRSVPGGGGGTRVWRATLQVPDAAAPALTWSYTDPATLPEAASVELAGRMRRARACVAGVSEDLGLPDAWYVHGERGGTRLLLDAADVGGSEATVSASVAGCVARQMSAVLLETPLETPVAGVLTLAVSVPAAETAARPEPTTFAGYALRVSARVGDESVGDTVLRMHPGTVPPLRLRFSEVLVDPGATVSLTAVRGPDFTGQIPEKLLLTQGGEKVLEIVMKDRKGSFTLPADARGYYRVEFAGAAATLFVRDSRSLQVALSSDTKSWRPGQEVQLTVTTTRGGAPVPAGVTLSGVDSAFAAIATLPTADAFADVTVRAASEMPAFGVLDARALQTGLIRGENAAQAAVLRVSSIPDHVLGGDEVGGQGAAVFDADAEMTDAFYALYAEARRGVRTWEKEAAAGETLSAKQMVAIWEEALAAHPAEDPFGRRLHLSVLPRDLLALTDPRFMMSDGARVPEDVESWTPYVAKEAP
jgi:hypothetical protein